MHQELEAEFSACIRARKGRPLRLRAGGSKDFYGCRTDMGNGCEVLDLSTYTGVVAYQPSELVVSVRAGTRLDQLQQALYEQGQMLAFEPPAFARTATIGGTVACGLAGPGRPWMGALRDSVLGIRCINGRGERLRFGGQVMKNVAGFDISRLMCGAMGTLGVLLEVSIKVLPRPDCDRAYRYALDNRAEAVRLMQDWAGSMPALSAICFDGRYVHLRLSGREQTLSRVARRPGLQPDPEGLRWWQQLREHSSDFFAGDTPLWRLSVPPMTVLDTAQEPCLIDWAGMQYWLRSQRPATEIRALAEQVGGHATLFRGGERQAAVFHPLPVPLRRLHQRIRTSFDPDRIFNPGRLYPEL